MDQSEIDCLGCQCSWVEFQPHPVQGYSIRPTFSQGQNVENSDGGSHRCGPQLKKHFTVKLQSKHNSYIVDDNG